MILSVQRRQVRFQYKRALCYANDGQWLTHWHRRADAGLSGTLVSRSTIAPALGLDLAYLKLDVAKAVDTIQIKITDPSASRWEVPRDLYSTRQLTGAT